MKPTSKTKGPNKTTITQMKRRYGLGASIKVLGDEFAMSRDAVRQALVDAGVTIRNRGRQASATA